MTTTMKPLIKSKTFWGGIVSILPVLGTALEVLGIVPPGTMEPITSALVAALGGLLSIWGRYVATKTISGLT